MCLLFTVFPDFTGGDVNVIAPKLIAVVLTAGVHFLEKKHPFKHIGRYYKLYVADSFLFCVKISCTPFVQDIFYSMIPPPIT